jgi:hypothetical protein
MLRFVPKVILLTALLTTLVISGISAFTGNRVCSCVTVGCFLRNNCSPGGCTFDKKTLQCITTGCKGTCQ